jgi:hypothetical protein
MILDSFGCAFTWRPAPLVVEGLGPRVLSLNRDERKASAPTDEKADMFYMLNLLIEL